MYLHSLYLYYAEAIPVLLHKAKWHTLVPITLYTNTAASSRKIRDIRLLNICRVIAMGSVQGKRFTVAIFIASCVKIIQLLPTCSTIYLQNFLAYKNDYIFCLQLPIRCALIGTRVDLDLALKAESQMSFMKALLPLTAMYYLLYSP